LTTSVSGTFSIRMRTVPLVSFATLPVPVDSGCAGPPLPAHAPTSSVAAASAATINGRRRMCLVDVIAACSFRWVERAVQLSLSGAPGKRVRARRGDLPELPPAGVGLVVDLRAGGVGHNGPIQRHEPVCVVPIVDGADAYRRDDRRAERCTGMSR